ncbi:hypothetical protein BCEP4_530016 [Burkholderia cepacia]|nr:hypothetical protein BCEP4_530016 [Burkholderia cepacia]
MSRPVIPHAECTFTVEWQSLHHGRAANRGMTDGLAPHLAQTPRGAPVDMLVDAVHVVTVFAVVTCNTVRGVRLRQEYPYAWRGADRQTSPSRRDCR